MNPQDLDGAMEHWTLAREPEGLAWLILDMPGAGTNVLSAPAMAELARVLDELEKAPPRGLIIRSGKAGSFIAGADIAEFTRIATPEEARALVARGWDLFKRLAAVAYPTLALIRGHCLGGGVELALACRYRIAVDDPATRLGLPEVQLGIFPGWGGMARLPAVVGPVAALDLMLTGKTVDARKAKALGLADLAVAPRVMEASARGLVLSGQPPRRAKGLKAALNAWPFRKMVAAQARRQVAEKARRSHYPAPYAIIDLWEQHGGNALAAPEVIEHIVFSATSRNLVRVFFLRERLKAFGKEVDFRARRVHVVGAGVMGGDIAAWCALQGLTVTLQDRNLEAIAPALGRARQLFARRLRDPRQARAAWDRLIPDPEGQGVPRADVVIEAIFENPDAKRALFQTLEPRLQAGAILATNTSSLKLEDLATVLARPERLVGIHFFNPVASLPLVEVVAAAGSDPEEVRRAWAFVRQLDKLPLPVKSFPGFLVNAVLAPYLLAAMARVDGGLTPETVDAAQVAFGMPMGPLVLADTVGLDILLAAGRQLAAGEPPACLVKRVEAGQLGKKSGRGFYAWEEGKPRRGPAGVAPPGLAEELLLPLMERAEELVAAGVVADADLADAGIIFATGFAPFTGGPLHYRRTRLAGGGAALAGGGG